MIFYVTSTLASPEKWNALPPELKNSLSISKGIYFAKYYGGGGRGDKNGCFGKKMKTGGVGKKIKKRKRGKGKRRKTA